jgi:hypothetical protein
MAQAARQAAAAEAAASLQCGELRLQCREAVVELLPELIDLLLDLLRLPGSLRRGLARRRDKNGYDSRRAHYLRRSHMSSGSERDPRRKP